MHDTVCKTRGINLRMSLIHTVTIEGSGAKRVVIKKQNNIILFDLISHAR
jgi:hypothetical protein